VSVQLALYVKVYAAAGEEGLGQSKRIPMHTMPMNTSETLFIIRFLIFIEQALIEAIISPPNMGVSPNT
jgi:hypothetical protein